MIRFVSVALAAIVAVSFTVAFAVSLASPHDGQAQTAARQAPVGGPSSPVVTDPARLRSVAALPALRVPPATPTPPPPTPVVAPEPTPVAPVDDEAAPPPAAPPPAAPAPAPPAPEPTPAPSQHGPTFDSSG
jgi:hypothetical protein